MRVAFLNPQGNFDPHDSYWTQHPDFGGQLVYVKEIACAMSELGVKTDIISRKIIDRKWPEFSGRSDKYEGVENLRILRFKCGPDHFLRKEELWPYLEEWVKNIIAFYKEEGEMPDFITGHYGDGGIACALMSKYEKIPFSFTAHSLGALKMDKIGINNDNIRDFERIFHFGKRLAAERISMKYSSVNFVSTQMERFEQYGHPKYSEFIDVKDDTHFKVCSPGVNRRIFNEFSDVSDRRFEKTFADFHKPLIILSSRLDHKKNHIAIMKAFAESEELQKRAQLMIIIRGVQDVYKDISPLKDNEQKIVSGWLAFIREKNLTNSVSFINAESQKDLASIYRASTKFASIFCNPALYEPFGLTVIEAMSCGLPVAATINGGPSEILSENGYKFGFLFDPEDISSITSTLLHAISIGNDYDKFSELSISRVLERYTWKNTAVNYLNEIKIKMSEYSPQEINISSFQKTLR
ncbi:MAG TPA: glycosyltransferase [Thermotogota bacterium]|nr:glycosyltransferase [Thermotogota bacterium]HPJ87509.1 glycosyltransferase [Thermotogota bacterium]HPR94714.1 glycosyltransferase [Thermotogota bacterium]